jgi:hypothetical protein
MFQRSPLTPPLPSRGEEVVAGWINVLGEWTVTSDFSWGKLIVTCLADSTYDCGDSWETVR